MLVNESYNSDTSSTSDSSPILSRRVSTATDNEIRAKNIKHRMKYSLEFKTDVIHEFEKLKNKSVVGEKFNIDRRLVGEWVQNKDKILSTSFKRKRTRVKSKNEIGRFPEMETKLVEWFDNQRRQNLSVLSWQIKLQANTFFNEIYKNTPNLNTFQASDGWMAGWLRRHNKALRRVTRICSSNTMVIRNLGKFSFTSVIKLVRLLWYNKQ